MDVQVSIPPPPPPPPPPPFFAETTTSQLIAPPPPPPPPPPFLQQPVTTITTTVTASVASPASQDRVWLHPWTVTEMRDNASQWSLAGDAGLLLYLEQFSDKLVQRADAIQQHLSQTVNAVKSTHTRVQNCLNEFTSLANTQFIENRVYDEDETAIAAASKKDEASTEKTNVSNTEAQEKVLQRYVEAVQYGLAILETHFERVDPKFDTMQNGDASYVDDDEDGGIPIEPILEPKDPYIYRPLPYLIGTTEFMEDDYVGLGDLLNVPDKDDYGVAEPKELDTDSAVSSSDQEDDDDFEVEVSPAPIVPAGASRPDIANQLRQPVTSMPSDSDDDDDPFGLNTGPTFDDFSSRKPVTANILSEKPIVPIKPKQADFDEGSDNDEDDMFGTISKKPPPVVETNNNNTFDNEPSASQESDESEEHKHVGGVSMFGGAQKNMSELEKAVLRRRKAMGDPDVQLDDEEDVVKKTTKTSNETISAAVIKTTTKPSTETPSSSTISNLASQPLTKPVSTTEKIPKQTIFGGRSPSDDDDEIDFFNDAPKPKPLATVISPPITTTTTKIETKPAPPIISGKKEKDLLDPDTDEDDNPFTFRRDNVSSSLQKKQNDSNPKIPPTIINKPPPVIKHDDSDDDGLFSPTKPTAKPIPTASTTTETKKLKSASSDDDIFNTLTNTKSQQAPAKPKTSEDKNPPFASKQPVRQEPVALVAPSSLITPSLKKPNVTVEEDSDDEIFGISKPRSKASATVVPTAVLSAKAADEDNVVGVTTTRPKVPITEAPKIIPVKSDDDDELFSFEQPQIKLPPPVVLPPLPSPPSAKSDDYEDPLFGTRKSVETTVQLPAAVPVKIPPPSVVQPAKKVLSDSEDEDITPKRELNKAALKEGEKPNVGRLASLLNINPTAHKPGARPKAPLNTEEPAKPSVNLDEPVVPVVKTLPKVDSDSDDDLFNNRKKPTPLVSTDQQKEKASEENASGKVTVKALSSLIKINPMAHTPNAQPKSTLNKENGSDDLTQTSATEVSKEEPTAEKTMLNILKDRAKLSVKTRTPPTRKPRSGGATATTATNDTDDFFALPSSTNTTAASSSPLPPPPTVVIPVIPPPVPVTGLLDNTAATAALSDQQAKSKEKKKILHFDSDDSDIDELLFGSSKKTKSPAETKPPPTITTTPSTTTKTKPKASILSLDDDDDFLAKRPIKKNAKALDNDDIFADVKSKSQQTTKAKKDWSIMNKSETDDIFTDTSAKSSNAAKSKSTNVKNKSVKDLDDIFDDPLNVTSKR